MFRKLYIRIALKLLRLWAKQNIKAELGYRGYMIIHTGAYLHEGTMMYVTDDFECEISPLKAMIRKEQQEILEELHRVRCYFCILKIRNFRYEYRKKQVNKKLKKL
jgi:hypothetical protein